jgi:hypothetical protein
MALIFPTNNLPEASQAWAREIQKQLVNVVSANNANQINNTARDSQLANSVASINGTIRTLENLIKEVSSTYTYAVTLTASRELTSGLAENELETTVSIPVTVPPGESSRTVTVIALGDTDLQVIPQANGVTRATVVFEIRRNDSRIGVMSTYCGVDPSSNWTLTDETKIMGGGALVVSGQFTVSSTGNYDVVVRATAKKARAGGTENFAGNMNITSLLAIVGN